jgi:hypothetical protein
MDNPEAQTILGTRHKTKIRKPKNRNRENIKR